MSEQQLLTQYAFLFGAFLGLGAGVCLTLLVQDLVLWIKALIIFLRQK